MRAQNNACSKGGHDEQTISRSHPVLERKTESIIDCNTKYNSYKNGRPSYSEEDKL